jgi:hypothetical protein
VNILFLALAVTGKWEYPLENTSVFILGNFLTSILMRSEIFTRFLYLSVNGLFARVNVSTFSIPETDTDGHGCAVATTVVSPCMHVFSSTFGGNSFRMRHIGLPLAHAVHIAYTSDDRTSSHCCVRLYHCFDYFCQSDYRDPLGEEFSSQVSFELDLTKMFRC